MPTRSLALLLIPITAPLGDDLHELTGKTQQFVIQFGADEEGFSYERVKMRAKTGHQAVPLRCEQDAARSHDAHR